MVLVASALLSAAEVTMAMRAVVARMRSLFILCLLALESVAGVKRSDAGNGAVSQPMLITPFLGVPFSQAGRCVAITLHSVQIREEHCSKPLKTAIRAEELGGPPPAPRT
jgi:hypothetical protein